MVAGELMFGAFSSILVRFFACYSKFRVGVK
jgi:hypothetical protein